jgi:hypothetical protein
VPRRRRKKKTVGPPDFIGVGTQRSGTTWWFGLLLEHPRIRGPKGTRKELHFFEPYGARELTDADVDAYHALFPRRRRQIVGEWTPRYIGDAWTPQLLRRAAPDAKLLVMLRDPIERFRSGIVHRQRRGPQRMAITVTDAMQRGRYASQLRELYGTFDREKVLVLQYEQCRADPAGQYARTLEFLGAKPFVPEELTRTRGNPVGAAKEPLTGDLEAALHAVLDDEVRALAELHPELDVSLWENFRVG